LQSSSKIGLFVGDKNPMYGIHLNGELNGMYGKLHTDEVKETLRQLRLGTTQSEITKQKISDSSPFKGKKQTSEFVAKRMLGIKLNKEKKILASQMQNFYSSVQYYSLELASENLQINNFTYLNNKNKGSSK
jgi:hypothetical protein